LIACPPKVLPDTAVLSPHLPVFDPWGFKNYSTPFSYISVAFRNWQRRKLKL